MGIENLKRWHWIVISLLVGLLLSYVYLSSEGETPRDSPIVTFQEEVAGTFYQRGTPVAPPKDLPMVTDIVVYPPSTNDQGKLVSAIKYRELVYKPDPKDPRSGGWFYKNVGTTADVPFQPLEPILAYKAVAGDTIYSILPKSYPGKTIDKLTFDALKSLNDRRPLNGGALVPGVIYSVPPLPVPSVVDWLKDQTKIKPGLKWNYAWWAETKKCFAVWTGGSVLVIGLIWPTILFGMIKAGLGRPPVADEYDISRFGKGSGKQKQQAAATGITADDMDRLKAFEDKVLASMSQERGDIPVAEKAVPAPIKKLDAAPLAPTEAAAPEHLPTDSRAYDGEFYPVVKKKH